MIRNHSRSKFKGIIQVYHLTGLTFHLILLLLTVVFFPSKFGVGIRQEKSKKCLITCFRINVNMTNLSSPPTPEGRILSVMLYKLVSLTD